MQKMFLTKQQNERNTLTKHDANEAEIRTKGFKLLILITSRYAGGRDAEQYCPLHFTVHSWPYGYDQGAVLRQCYLSVFTNEKD
jgi:hypothetical protein